MKICHRFNASAYEQRLDELFNEIGLVFDGKASEQLAEIIESKL